MLYHYTSIDSFVGMVESARKSNGNDHLVFWASSIFAMNDPMEFKYGIDLIKKLVEKYEEEKQIANKYKLSTSFEDELAINPNFSNENYLLDRYFVNPPKTPFVISFSRNDDDLAMWDLYGNKGKGLCLHFDEDIPPFTENDPIISQKLIDVDYSGDIEKNETLYSIFENEYKKSLDLLKQETSEAEIAVKRCLFLAIIYHFLCPFIKHHKYKNEKEVRISGLPNSMEYIKYRTRNANIIPYVEMRIDKKHLKGITIGPCCDFESLKRGINNLLYSIGLNADPLMKEDLPITHSNIPYRLL
ncbi:MAG: DUF2971 domain-containing protein [Prevotella sp.]|nr:DUF2971 domain-containing protein [Prevotella sp.]